MGDNLTMLLTFAFIANSLLALIAILLHYEVLFQLDKYLPKVAHIAPRFKVLLSVGVIFLAHVLEIWIFALGYYATLQFP
ncbi:MAG: ion transporter, partial [Polynucleobacter sp. 16-46-70]